MSGPSNNDVREQLRRYGKQRDEAISALARANHHLGHLLRRVQSEYPFMTMTEAARIAGVSRPIAYKLMAKVGGSTP